MIYKTRKGDIKLLAEGILIELKERHLRCTRNTRRKKTGKLKKSTKFYSRRNYVFLYYDGCALRKVGVLQTSYFLFISYIPVYDVHMTYIRSSWDGNVYWTIKDAVHFKF
jgi:hypothetical protein